MTRRLVVLGAGTAGTMIVNKLRRRLPGEEWDITVVDRDDVHPYQPGFLMLPFGTYDVEHLQRPRHDFVPDGVHLVLGEVDRVDPHTETVHLEGGRTLDYDYLVIATGTSPRPDQTPGMLGPAWRRLWACRLSADMNHLTADDLYDEVEGIISASDFIEKTDGAQLLFI